MARHITPQFLVMELQADMVSSCSVLELFILVAMYRIKRRGHDSANFEMVHDEYCKLMDQGSTGDKRSKAAALRAFERLIASSLVSYVDSRSVFVNGARCTFCYHPIYVPNRLKRVMMCQCPLSLVVVKCYLYELCSSRRCCSLQPWRHCMWSHCRAEEKGGLREFHLARVTVLMQEIDAGLKLQKSCPGLLKNALAHEAVCSAFAH